MKNKEQKIVRLLEEGFSYETIKKMSNLHINKICESLDEVDTVSTTTKVYKDGDKEKFTQDVNNMIQSGKKGQVGKTETGDDTLTTKSSEVSEDSDSDKSLEKESGFNPYDGNSVGNDDGTSNYGVNPNAGGDGMGIAEEEINEEEVIEALFGKPKKKMKRPIGTLTTLGMFEQQELSEKCWKGYEKKGMKTMFGKKYPNCVKKKKKTQKEEKVRQIEENIVSLIKKTKGKVITKKDILEEQPNVAPVKPTVKPGVKPERGNPYKPKHSPKPKAGTEVKPAKPTVKPGVKPERGNPYKPKHSPKPKAGEDTGLPEFLKFNNLNIKFRDE